MSVLCSHVNDPSTNDYDHAMRNVSYLSSTLDYGLCFNGYTHINRLVVYCETAVDIDDNYCSRTGIVILSCGALILCNSKGQGIVIKASVVVLLSCGVKLTTSTVYEDDNKAVLQMI